MTDDRWKAYNERKAKKDIRTSIEMLLKSAWISVDDLLPEQNEICLVADTQFPDGVYDARWKDGKWESAGLSITAYAEDEVEFVRPYSITHWMPLPEKPPPRDTELKQDVAFALARKKIGYYSSEEQ